MGCTLSEIVQKQRHQLCNIILFMPFTFNILEKKNILYEKRKNTALIGLKKWDQIGALRFMMVNNKILHLGNLNGDAYCTF